jgi:hypothetical protein
MAAAAVGHMIPNSRPPALLTVTHTLPQIGKAPAQTS